MERIVSIHKTEEFILSGFQICPRKYLLEKFTSYFSNSLKMQMPPNGQSNLEEDIKTEGHSQESIKAYCKVLIR